MASEKLQIAAISLLIVIYCQELERTTYSYGAHTDDNLTGCKGRNISIFIEKDGYFVKTEMLSPLKHKDFKETLIQVI